MKKVLSIALITAAVSVGVLNAKSEHNTSSNTILDRQDTTKKDTTSKKLQGTKKRFC